MPYIKPNDREFYKVITDIIDTMPMTQPGELNYLVTYLITHMMKCSYEVNYNTYNAIIGALECAKLELYRRKVEAYEDEKRGENGDVY